MLVPVAVATVILILLCFGSGFVHCAWDGLRPVASVHSAVARAHRPRCGTMRLGEVTCEVVSFEDFELIKTSEYDLDAAGL